MIIALFLMTAMSIIAASLMFLSQTETYASLNYKIMSQARYGAESGVERAGNFLFDTAQYQKPGTVVTDPLSNYDYSGSPVKYNGQPVVLSSRTGVASNYPVASVITAFNNAAKGTLAADRATVNYAASAKLISMQTFDPYGGASSGTPGVVQTWEITSDGTLSGARTATVEVVAYAEQPVWPASSYAAFATANICGALYFHGNVTINSYDSTTLTGNTTPTFYTTGGNVGTNGNLEVQGSTDVQGNLYTPRAGVGSCTANAVDALSEIGSADVRGSIVQLPGTVVYPTPPAPSPLPSTTAVSITSSTNACTALTNAGASWPSGTCSTSGSGSHQKVIISGGGSPISLPSVSLGSQITLEIAGSVPAQVVNINSLDLTGGGTIAVNSSTSSQTVLFNLAGKNSDGTDMTTVVDFGGNSGGQFANDSACVTCSTFDASMMQFLYAGTGTINLRGTSSAAATFYAPNATVNFNGTADLYGSMLGKTITNGGNANIHYDRRLSHDFYVQGAQMLGTFTWSRF